MNLNRFNNLIHECIKEVLTEEGRRICAWCKKDLGALNYSSDKDSHGICPECAKKALKNIPPTKNLPDKEK